MKSLETKRLLLREWVLDDLEDMYNYAKQRSVGPNAGWKPHTSQYETLNILKDFIEKDETWAIVYKDNKEVIGSIGVHPVKDEPDTIKEVGFVLSHRYWGEGIMPECVKEVIRFCFEELELEELRCSHFDFNIRSKRVVEKCGFEFLEVLRKGATLYDGNTYDLHTYRWTKSRYSMEQIKKGNHVLLK